MSEKFSKTTPISELGEFGLIKRLTEKIELKHDSTIKGVGDDAAILDYSDKQIVVTKDLLVEGIHFNLAYTPLKHLGYKAAMVNLSDIYAMNGKPKQILIGIAMSSRFSFEMIEELYEGIHMACEKHDVDIIGGDTTSSQAGLSISITALGEVEKGKAVYRSGAKKNDLICVSGDLGGAFMGLQLLERENQIFQENPNAQPDLDGYDYILQRQLRPEARQDVIEILKQMEITPTSMIDISDGLSSELLHICEKSNVGCKIFQDKIPLGDNTIKMSLEFDMEPTMAALSGGEDYELLFTVPMEMHEKLKNDPDITVIGHITDADVGHNLVTVQGNFIQLRAQGWNSIKDIDEDEEEEA